MRFSKVFILPLAFLVLCSTPFLGFAQTDEDLQEMYMQELEKRQWDPEVDSDGDVQFTYQDRTYFIETNEDDLEYFRLVLPNIWPIESHKEAIEVIMACDDVNNSVKVARAYTVDDNVWIEADIFIIKPRDFKDVLDRCLETVDLAVDTFVESMQGE